MIKRTIQQDNINFFNVALNRGASKYIKQIIMDIKREFDSKAVIVGALITPVRMIDINSRENQ